MWLCACTHCRLKSQTSSTSLILLSRFTAMLIWDLHQNGLCTAQTEPMSQLESLRNGVTHTNTHTQSLSHTISVPHYLSLSDTSAYSQSLELSLLHTYINTQTHTHINTHHSPWGHCLWPLRLEERKNAETVKKERKKESENKTGNEQVREKEAGAASQTAQDEPVAASSHKMLQKKKKKSALAWLQSVA